MLALLMMFALSAAPKTEPIFELSKAPIRGGGFGTVTKVWPDGRWERNQGGDKKNHTEGTLTEDELAALTVAIKSTTFVVDETERVFCEAVPTQRLRVRGLGKEIVWEAPCAIEPSPSVRALVGQVGELTRSDVLVAFERGTRDAWHRELEVLVDGTWRDGAGSGKLSEQALAKLQRAIDREPMVDAEPGPCYGIENTFMRVTLLRRGTVQRFVSGTKCGGTLPVWVDKLLSQDVRPALESAPSTTTLIEIETRRTARGGDAHWRTIAKVMESGAWRSGAREGQLDPRTLADLKAMARAAGGVGERPTCKALSFNFTRVTVGGAMFEEASPCGVQLSPSVAALRDTVLGLVLPPIVTVSEGGMGKNGWRTTLRVASDGTFARDAVTGKLSPGELEELRQLVERARFVIEPINGPVCAALPTHRTKVETERGTVEWSSPCAPEPHRSVREVIDWLDGHIAIARELVTLSTGAGVTNVDYQMAVTVQSTGTVITPTGMHQLTPEQLARLEQALAQLDDSSAPKNGCRAMPIRHQRLEVSRPGVPLVLWSHQPCGIGFTPAAEAVVKLLESYAGKP